jgi:hypothetical protein
MAIKADGTVVVWGANWNGETNVPPTATDVVAIAVSESSLMALRNNGSVIVWGSNNYNQTNVPPRATNVAAIAAGAYHCLALRRDGSVIAWGANDQGQTNLPPELSNVVAIAAGANHNLALKEDGTVVAWGSAYNGVTNVPVDLTDAIGISARGYVNMVIRRDGALIAWGDTASTPYTPPPWLRNVAQFSCGSHHYAAFVDETLPRQVTHLATPQWQPGQFSLNLSTLSGRIYYLLYTDSLTGNRWTALPPVPGNGRIRTLTDPAAPAPQRFYRVEKW